MGFVSLIVEFKARLSFWLSASNMFELVPPTIDMKDSSSAVLTVLVALKMETRESPLGKLKRYCSLPLMSSVICSLA